MYSDKNDIEVTNRRNSTRLKSKSNNIVPKMKTVFEQHLPKNKYIRFCYSHDLIVNNF